MSATEASPSPAGMRDDQPVREEPESLSTQTSLLETPNDSSKDLDRTDVSMETTEGSQTPDELSDRATDSTPAEQPPPSTPSQSDLLAGQLDKLSVSATDVPKALPSSQENTSPPPPPPPPPEKDDAYMSSHFTTSVPALQTSEPTSGPSSEKELPDVPGDSDPESRPGGRTGRGRDDNDSQPEIQTIMGQFQDPDRSTDQQEIMSPRMELAEQFRGGQNYFPPRKSSLDHMQPPLSGSLGSHSQGSQSSPASQYIHKSMGSDEPTLTRQSSASTVPPLPEPESDQPFDFHRFLEQLRHRTADPVAKFLRSFLMEFGKKQWMVHEQVKIISDFLAFITNKMAMCEVWRDVSDSEFDNAKEGMEKLVMNRLYTQTFAPAIPAPPSIPRSASRSRRREIERLHGPWRRGQHQEDIERDDILAQKIRIYSWVKEEHLDIPPVSGGGRRFLNLAQQGKPLYPLSHSSSSNRTKRNPKA